MSRKVHYFKAGGIMYRIGYPITWVIFKLLWFYRSFHTRKLPTQGGAILASNHASNFDPVLVGLTSFRPVKFLARESLFYNPLFGWIISSLGAFPIMRAKAPEGGTVDASVPVEGAGADMRALRTAIDLLKGGHRLVMFPEGTRSASGKLRNFQPGVAMMFLRSQAPLVPIYIHGNYRVLPRGAKSPHVFRTVKVFVGDPILYEQLPAGLRSKKQHEWILTQLHDRIAAMQTEAWAKYPLPQPPADEEEPQSPVTADAPVPAQAPEAAPAEPAEPVPVPPVASVAPVGSEPPARA